MGGISYVAHQLGSCYETTLTLRERVGVGVECGRLPQAGFVWVGYISVASGRDLNNKMDVIKY